MIDLPEELKTVKIPVSVWKEAKIEAAKQGIPICELLTKALRSYKEKLDKEEVKK